MLRQNSEQLSGDGDADGGGGREYYSWQSQQQQQQLLLGPLLWFQQKDQAPQQRAAWPYHSKRYRLAIESAM
jgi:hypothetical protein